MTDRLLLVLVGAIFLWGTHSIALGIPGSTYHPVSDTLGEEPRTLILDQANAPVSLIDYEADYDGVRLFRSSGVRHEVAFRNPGNRDIVAVQFRFVMYSVFNDVIEKKDGVYLDPLSSGESEDDAWTYDPPDASSFRIGAAYVRKVRFADGEIWEADIAEVDDQLSRIERGEIDDLVGE